MGRNLLCAEFKINDESFLVATAHLESLSGNEFYRYN